MPGRPIDNEEHKRDKLLKRIAALEALSPVPGEIRAFALPEAPAGWLEADGSAILITEYEELAAAMYCGDSRNATADWGYRVTSGVRSTSGTHIVLPDYRGEFLRGWDHGRGKDPGRDLYSAQTQALNSHNHTGSVSSDGSHNHGGSTTTNGDHIHAYSLSQVTTNDNTTVGGSAPRVMTHTTAVMPTSTSGSHSHSISTDFSGAHTHSLTINNEGGNETRPTNLAALICIKT